jgi:hypothetical protein
MCAEEIDHAPSKSKTGPQDADRLNVNEDYEVRYWSKKSGVSPEALKAAVSKIGPTAHPARLVANMFASHEVVNRSIGEYARGNAHTNTIEGYFSIMKRGITGVSHHVSALHKIDR